MNIAINTTQNVTIEYELASVRERIFAFMLDYFTILITMWIMWFVAATIFGWHISEYVVYFVLIPYFVFYSLTSEILFNGQSLGKLALGIKVIKLNGKEPETGDFIMRWAFRVIDIYVSLGMIASSIISSGNKGQRLGDLIANTCVVRKRPSKSVSLREILSIRTLGTYEPKFLNVKTMKEEEMLLLKQVIERSTKYPNEAHLALLKITAETTAKKLDVKVPPNKIEFLRTVLKDYVVLSR